MTTKDNTQFADKVVDTLRKAAVEIEEFQVQAALGKAEAQEKYEELKKKFDLFIHDSKFKMKEGKGKLEGVNTKLDELRVQLALGKAESLDAFKVQKKKLLLKLHELEVEIKTNETLNKMYAFVLLEIEKFRVNLEILEQKFDEGKEESKSSFEKGRQEFSQFIDNFKNKYTKKEETRWEHFQGEISEAFDHFKHAFKKA